MLRAIITTLIRLVSGFAAFIACYFLVLLVLSHVGVNSCPVNGNDVMIYLTTDEIHTDLVLPANTKLFNWNACLGKKELPPGSPAPYLAFGWGDKAFYLETPGFADLKLNVALKAGFGLTPSAIHIARCREPIIDAHTIPLQLTTGEYQNLIAYLTGSFKTGAYGHLISINTPSNYPAGDLFFEANRHYSIFYTCNTWANNALKSCGQKACVWTVFYNGIFNQYK
jgi:uncharacterized protein (TIGR02117 family)